MAKKLWDKGDRVNTRMQVLTVDDDPTIDLRLVCSDALGSAAHARMLAKQAILTDQQAEKLITELQLIFKAGREGSFEIPFELEDVHTAIEARLQETCGDVGKRIHAARSRNDQVCLAVRLYMRSKLTEILNQVFFNLDALSVKFKQHKNLFMPGYTHLQPAMPSSVGLWLHSFYEALLLNVKDGLSLYASIDYCPLGSGAGFGTNLEIDRKFVAEILGFVNLQRSPIDVNNSRGLYEQKFLNWCTTLVFILEKFACDISLFCTQEFAYVSLPVELTTGSSIMPQKRNPDLVELLRARPSKVRAALSELSGVTAKLTSSYHRDLQFTKAPLVKGIEETLLCLEMFQLTLTGMKFNADKLEAADYPELYATYFANNLVAEGLPFRDAYQQTAQKLKSGELSEACQLRKEFEVIQSQCLSAMQEAESEKESLSVTVLELEAKQKQSEINVFSKLTRN